MARARAIAQNSPYYDEDGLTDALAEDCTGETPYMVIMKDYTEEGTIDVYSFHQDVHYASAETLNGMLRAGRGLHAVVNLMTLNFVRLEYSVVGEDEDYEEIAHEMVLIEPNLDLIANLQT